MDYEYLGNVSWEYPYDDTYDVTIRDGEVDIHLSLTVFNTLQGLCTAAALLANTLLLVLLAISPRHRTVSNMFILQRAAADMMYLTSLLFVIVIRAFVYTSSGSYIYTFATCIALSIVTQVGTVAGLLFFIMFTVDSYFLSRPERHTLPSRRKVMKLTSAIIWLTAAIVGVSGYYFTARRYETDRNCVFSPLFDYESFYVQVIIAFTQLIVPMVVVWVFVILAIKPHQPAALPSPNEEERQEHEGPNRRLLLGLSSSYTLLHGLYWFMIILHRMTDVLPLEVNFILHTLPSAEDTVTPILVMCFTAGLLPACRRSSSASVPLRDL